MAFEEKGHSNKLGDIGTLNHITPRPCKNCRSGGSRHSYHRRSLVAMLGENEEVNMNDGKTHLVMPA
jgi:hypothetical protein